MVTWSIIVACYLKELIKLFMSNACNYSIVLCLVDQFIIISFNTIYFNNVSFNKENYCWMIISVLFVIPIKVGTLFLFATFSITIIRVRIQQFHMSSVRPRGVVAHGRIIYKFATRGPLLRGRRMTTVPLRRDRLSLIPRIHPLDAIHPIPHFSSFDAMHGVSLRACEIFHHHSFGLNIRAFH